MAAYQIHALVVVGSSPTPAIYLRKDELSVNSNTIGNMAESVILSEFQKMEIPVCIPFGRNEPYDLIIDTKDGFKSVQVKHGKYKNGCIVSEITHKRTYKKTQRESYKGVVDYIAIWCSELNRSYLIKPDEFRAIKTAYLRVDQPKNNASISTVVWAEQYEFEKIADGFRKVK